MKPISLQEGTIALFTTIAEKRTHPDYHRTVELAKDYTIYATGKGVEEKLIRFNTRESEEVFEQRKRLTQVTTPDIVGTCVKPMYKVGRTPAKKMFIIPKDQEGGDNQKENEKKIVDAGRNFYGNQSVEEYLETRLVELDATDPNSFIVVEFTNQEGSAVIDPSNPESKAVAYPFEVSAEEAINFKYRNNILQWLVVRNRITIRDNKGKDYEGFKYTMYLSENSVVAEQIHKSMADSFLRENPNAVKLEYETFIKSQEILSTEGLYLLMTKEKGKELYFVVRVGEHKIGFVPAMRVGCIRDLTTRGRTRVPLIHQAKAYLDKAIKTISEFDLTNCLHVFPQKIQYSEACAGYTEEKEGDSHVISCSRGLTPDGKNCKACNGTGFKVHKSASDVIQIAMPRDVRDMASLENFLVYKQPPSEILEFQKKLGLYELRQLANMAVYNSEVFSAEGVVKTATEEKIDLDTVYDTLKPFADNYSEIYCFIFRCIASLSNIKVEEISHKFPSDFKMKSTADLLNELKLANENQASSHVKEAITRDIIRKYYADNPLEILKMETKEKYIPFSGKSDTQIALIMAGDTVPEATKILYSNFDEIFSELEFENSEPNFYSLEEKKQRELIKKKTEEFMQRVNEEQKSEPIDFSTQEE